MAASPRGGRSGAAGRTPGTSRTGAGRKGASGVRRSRAAPPARVAAVEAAATRRRRTTLTARAAVLALALASVALAVALPFKIWLAQRGEISSLQAQTRQQQQHVEALHIDLADLRGYHYQNGAIFSIFTAGETSAIGNGGRYDGIGRAFGRARPATGFTLDLRQLAGIVSNYR